MTDIEHSLDTRALMSWLDACPTPFHVVERAGATLTSAGFTAVQSLSDDLPENGYLSRDGMVVAWRRARSSTRRFHIVGAHTDSPNLRVHPRPDMVRAGWGQLGVEIYGGVLLNSWLDRDLGIAGRIVTHDGQCVLFSDRRALARVPQLAIHLDRDISERGLQLDRQQHMTPVWSTGDAPTFRAWLSSTSGVNESDIATYDAHLFDVTPAALLGADSSLLASARLDNQVSCWAAITALAGSAPSTDTTQVVALFDHEEVGSESTTGAAGPLLAHVLESLHAQSSPGRPAFFDALSRSLCVSADNAHALHPNYQERHEPNHAPVINAGPALKVNNNQRYATSARTAQRLLSIAAAASVPLQIFMSRNNMPCGSTIGPVASTGLGIDTVDVGVPQLSMHSAREVCGALDPGRLRQLLGAFFADA